MNPYNKFKKIRNAPNGDPRFFIDKLDLAKMVGATVAEVEAVAVFGILKLEQMQDVNGCLR